MSRYSQKILFDMSKLRTLKEKHQAGEPVKIIGCLVDKAANKIFAELVINSKSKILAPQPGDITFNRTEPKLAITLIKDIEKTMINQCISLRGLVVADDSKVRLVQCFEKPTKITDQNTISDETGVIPLTLWEEWINYFKENDRKCFKLYNLVVKYFGTLYVTTCSETFV